MPTADAIAAAAAGNLSPTAPGLTQAAAGGNLSPAAPFLAVAADSHSAPLPPALLAARVLPVGAMTFLTSDGQSINTAVIPAGTSGGKPLYTTTGLASIPDSGSWWKCYYSDGRWQLELYLAGEFNSAIGADPGSEAKPSAAVWPSLGGLSLAVTETVSTAAVSGIA